MGRKRTDMKAQTTHVRTRFRRVTVGVDCDGNVWMEDWDFPIAQVKNEGVVVHRGLFYAAVRATATDGKSVVVTGQGGCRNDAVRRAARAAACHALGEFCRDELK